MSVFSLASTQVLANRKSFTLWKGMSEQKYFLQMSFVEIFQIRFSQLIFQSISTPTSLYF